jgi:plastocyanin
MYAEQHETPYQAYEPGYAPLHNYDFTQGHGEETDAPPAGWGWSDLAMPVVAGSLMGFAAAAYSGKEKKVSSCGNPDCTCADCSCGPGCQCGKMRTATLGVSGTEATMYDKVKQAALAALVSVGLFTAPMAAHAAPATVKMGSDTGQLVFVPDEVSVKVGESVTWVGNVGMPHNVVFDEENVPDGADLASLNHEDQVGDVGGKVSSKFTKAGAYQYYCEPHRGAGMNGVVNVE